MWDECDDVHIHSKETKEKRRALVDTWYTRTARATAVTAEAAHHVQANCGRKNVIASFSEPEFRL